MWNLAAAERVVALLVVALVGWCGAAVQGSPFAGGEIWVANSCPSSSPALTPTGLFLYAGLSFVPVNCFIAIVQLVSLFHCSRALLSCNFKLPETSQVLPAQD